VAKQKFLFSLRKSFPSNPVISSDEVFDLKNIIPCQFFKCQRLFLGRGKNLAPRHSRLMKKSRKAGYYPATGAGKKYPPPQVRGLSTK